MLAADPNALVVVSARGASEAHKCFPGVAGFPGGGVRDVDYVRIVGRDGDAHRAGTAAADAAIAVDEVPRFSGVIGAVNSRSLLCFHRGVHAAWLTWRDRDTDAAETAIVRRWQALRYLAPVVPAIRRLVKSAAWCDERLAATDFPGRDARGPKYRVDRLRIVGIKGEIGGADIFILVQNPFKRLAAIGGVEDASLFVRTIRVALHRHEDAIGIFRIDENRGDLLRIRQAQVRPSL